MKYKLGDLTVASYNSWDKVPRDAFLLFGGNIMAGATAGQILAAKIITGIAVYSVTSYVLRALAPKMSFAGQQGLLVNAREATAPQQIVYGEVRKGGYVTFMESTGATNQYVHQIIVLAGHEVNAINDIYINDEIVTWNSSTGYVTSSKWQDADGNSKIRIRKHLGADNQTADSDLVSETSVTSDFKGEGIAYLYVRLEYDQNVFAEGLPLITAMVQGKKVYDPRNSTTAYSANAALCIRDYIVSTYGLDNVNATDDSTNTTSFQISANTCDENVDLATTDAGSFTTGETYTIKTVGTTDFTAIGASGNTAGVTFTATGAGSGSGTAVLGSSLTEKRYEINGVIGLDQTPSDILTDMMTSCAGTLFWGQGKWHLKVGEYNASVKTFTLDDLRSPITLDTKHSRRDNFNIVRGTFTDARQKYIRADYPEIRSSTFITNDNGIENPLDFSLPFTTSSPMAQRLAKMTLFRAREQMTLTADFGLEAFQVECGDVVAFTNSRYGFNAKEFEVVGWKFMNDPNVGDLRVTLTLRETSSSAFSWTAEESEITGNNSTLTDVSSNIAPSSITVTDLGDVQTDGSFVSQVKVSWSAATNKFITNYEIRYKVVGNSDYLHAQTDADETTIVLSGLQAGSQYNVEVRGVTVNGRYSAWIAATPHTVGGDTTAPSPVTGLGATGGIQSVTLDWTAPTTEVGGDTLHDLSGYLIYRNTSNSQPTGAIAFVNADKYVDGGLSESTSYYYWVEAVDFTGNPSTAVASGAVTTQATPQDGATGPQGPAGPTGPQGPTGATGSTGANGGRYAVITYYQEAASTPSISGLASGATYTWSTGAATATVGSWSTTAPTVDAAGSNNYYYSNVTFIDTSGSASTSSGSSATTAVQLFNFNGLVTFTNTSGTTTLNTALSDSSTVINGGNITTGTINADRVNIDGVTLDTNASNQLIIRAGGVDTAQIAANAISQIGYQNFTNSTYTVSSAQTVNTNVAEFTFATVAGVAVEFDYNLTFQAYSHSTNSSFFGTGDGYEVRCRAAIAYNSSLPSLYYNFGPEQRYTQTVHNQFFAPLINASGTVILPSTSAQTYSSAKFSVHIAQSIRTSSGSLDTDWDEGRVSGTLKARFIQR